MRFDNDFKKRFLHKRYFWKRKVFGKILKTLWKFWKITYSDKKLFVLFFGETPYTKNTLISRNIVKHILITLSIVGEIFKRIYLIFKDYIALKNQEYFYLFTNNFILM